MGRQVLVRVALEGILVAFGVVIGKTAAWVLIAVCTAVLVVDGVYRFRGSPFIEARSSRSAGREIMDVAMLMLEDPALEVSSDSQELLSSDQSSVFARFNTESVPKLAKVVRRLVKNEVIDRAESKALISLVTDMRSYEQRLLELVSLGRQLGAVERREVRISKGEIPSIRETVAQVVALKEAQGEARRSPD